MTTPTANVRRNPSVEPFVELLTTQLRFQQRWRRLSMSLYVATTTGTLAFTSAATLLAAWRIDWPAAVLAALATLLVGFEKGLSCRERWKLHTRIVTLLQNIWVSFEAGSVNLEDSLERYERVMMEYAEQAPIKGRDE